MKRCIPDPQTPTSQSDVNYEGETAAEVHNLFRAFLRAHRLQTRKLKRLLRACERVTDGLASAINSEYALGGDDFPGFRDPDVIEARKAMSAFPKRLLGKKS